MYDFTGQSQYGSYNSTVQSQQTPHTPTLGAIGATNPTSVYASLSNAAGTAQGASPYAAYAASPSAAAAYAQYGQTAAAVAAVQQQQLQAETGVVSTSRGYGAATRLTNSYSTLGTVPSPGGTYTSLADYTNTLRSAAAAAAASQPTSNNISFVGVTRIGTSQSNKPLANSAQSVTGTSSAASNYSGYDAAVYAAASSYLQSKVAGTTNVWMGSGKKMGSGGYGSGNVAYTGSGSTNMGSGMGRGQVENRGRGTFPTKRFGGQSRPAGDEQQFYCEVCKISCTGSQTYKEHIDGRKHKKKEAQQKGEGRTLSKSRVSFRCETCNVTCTGKDTYQSHVRGRKHQKTTNLMKKLGKPVPDAPTVLALGQKSNATSGAQAANGEGPISTVGGPAVPNKRVVGVTKVNFVGGQKLQTGDSVTGATDAALEAAGHKNAAVEAALAAQKDVQPVGEAYVEEERNAQGKFVQYNCKLCDCKFSDPNAKNIHIKGRKHRLQYKLKVNPEQVVDVKPNQVPREMRNELARKMRGHNAQGNMMMPRPYGPMQPLMYEPPHQAPAPMNLFGMMDPEKGMETSEDRHVMAKHKQVYPDDAQLSAVEKLVTMIEKALRGVSDHFANKDGNPEVKAEPVAETQSGDKKEIDGDKDHHDRLLKGVMRVGLLAKRLLIKTDKEVQLVVLCSQPPTRTLLSQVAKLLPEHIKKGESEIVTALEKVDESALLVEQSDTDIICRIVLSAVMLRDDATNAGESSKENVKSAQPIAKDPLPKGPCLEALAELRHVKWFQARCANLQSAAVTLRIIREIRHRVPAWKPLSTWATELFVVKVLASHSAPLAPGDAVRRVFEAIASGALYSAGPGLKDPCEKDGRDVLAELSGQQREDITSGSQHALRLIAFNQMYKVLNVERLADPRPQPGNNTGQGGFYVRRPQAGANGGGAGAEGAEATGTDSDGEDVIDVKKGKKDEAAGEDKSIA